MSLNNDFINNTIVCNDKKEVDLDALNLLASGTLTSFCPCAYKNENKHHHFVYDTSNGISLAQLQAGLSFENVVDILSSTAEMLQTLHDHHLLLDNVKNAREYLFKVDEGYKFVYIPIVQKRHICVRDYLIKLVSVIHHRDIRLTQFLKNLRKKKDDREATEFLIAFVSSYGYGNEWADAEDATSLLREENAVGLYAGRELQSLLYDECAEEGDTSLLCENPMPERSINSVDEEIGTSLLSNEGETTVLSQTSYTDMYGTVNTDGYPSVPLTEIYQDASSEYETTVLSASMLSSQAPMAQTMKNEHHLCLIRNLNGEKIIIDVTPFTIGKDSANMDYVLNNDSVSRHHATVIYEEGSYFLVDNHSTNGTTLEGIRLQPGEKGEVDNGYIITLGSESFQAQIERR